MAIVKMDRVEIYGLNKNRKQILEYLHRKEIMEFSEISEEGISKKDTVQYISQFDSYIAAAGQAISILQNYVEEKVGLFSKREVLGADRYSMDKDEVNRVDKYVRRVIKNQRSIKDNEESIGKITAKQEMLSPYLDLDIPMNISSTKETFIKIGTLDGEWDKERIINAFSEEDINSVHIEIVKAEKQKTYLWLLYPKNSEQKVLEVFRKIGFVQPTFSLSHHTPKKKTEILEEAKRALLSENEVYRNDLKLCAEFMNEIKLFYDHLVMRREKYEALSKVGMTKNTFVMKGYIPEKLVPDIQKDIEEKYSGYVIAEKPSEDEDVPVAFSNGGFSAPVEGITGDYSMPSAKDIDPNPIMAFFYYWFFGMMFSDAGYGLLLMVVCGLLGFGNFMEKKKRRMFKMFFYCGVSTTFWGIMYGSFFGDMIATVSKTFGDGSIAFKPILMDPVAKPLELLILSVAFGMIHILTGLVIKFYMLWRDKKRLDAIFDVGFWILVLLGASIMAAGMGLSVSILSTVGTGMAIVGAVGLVLTQGRDKKNIFAKFFGGILSLYDITSYVGDVLSYSRLMALGLATGVIASVINVLGSLGGNSIVGLIAYIAISIVGHALNFAINMLGAYVHTNRLQYVEFYQKFYEGGGRKFKPLSMNTKYYDFSENN